MSSDEQLRAQCEVLLNLGSLPRSACRAALLALLRPLVDSGVLVEERSGAGRRLVVREAVRAREFVANRFPNAGAFPGASSRVLSVGGYRDSKTLERDEPEIVCARGWQAGVFRREGVAVDVAGSTTAHGVFSFLLDKNSLYTLNGPCALVENVSVLLHCERLSLPVSLVLWSRGRMSDRFLRWLEAQAAPEFTVLHLPDYDPVGLGEFTRLRRRLGLRARLHLPPDLTARFARFSNRAILDKSNNRALLAGVRRNPLPEVRQVLDLIDQHNAVLEQEALLVPLG